MITLLFSFAFLKKIIVTKPDEKIPILELIMVIALPDAHSSENFFLDKITSGVIHYNQWLCCR